MAGERTDRMTRRRFLERAGAGAGAGAGAVAVARGGFGGGSRRSARAGDGNGAGGGPAERFRTTVPMRTATSEPGVHFFGYYDKCPWSPDGRMLLACRAEFQDRQPERGETIDVGVLELDAEGNPTPGGFRKLESTSAWSWQQGTMLQWLPGGNGREIVYNASIDDRHEARIRDVETGATRTLPRPIYAIDPAGKRAATLDYSRLHALRPGYGYAWPPDPRGDARAPDDSGIFAMDMETGDSRLILSLAWAASNRPDDRFGPESRHWFNHLQFNPSGTRFVFLHRWSKANEPGWWTRMYTAEPDGSDPRLIADHGMVSHFDWRDDDTLLAWAAAPETGNKFYLFDARGGLREAFADGVLTRDGHCSFSPDRRWLLDDTYPDRDRMQRLILFEIGTNRAHEIGAFYLPPELSGPTRCDLHPRWNRDGTRVCIDSAHGGTRQMHILDVSSVVRG